jgi:hypothetical protein
MFENGSEWVGQPSQAIGRLNPIDGAMGLLLRDRSKHTVDVVVELAGVEAVEHNDVMQR